MDFPDTYAPTENTVERNNRLITGFLDREIAASEGKRGTYWNRDFSGAEAYTQSVEKNRERLRFITGVRDERSPFEAPELCETFTSPALFAETENHRVYSIRWPVFENLSGEGLLLESRQKPAGTVIHIPHAGVTPEQLVGLETPVMDSFFTWPRPDQRMIIPAMVDRNTVKRRMSMLTNREYIYRAAFQLGRHIIGYEIQEVLALIDWIKKESGAFVRLRGHGDGGLIALYAAALDGRIDEAEIVDYFNNRNRLCDEPIDRNVFGLLEQFGDAEIASLIAPRKLIITNYNAPELVLTSETGGAPGRLQKPDPNTVGAEIVRAQKLLEPAYIRGWLNSSWIEYREAPGLNTAADTIKRVNLSVTGTVPDSGARAARIIRGMDKHNQALLDISVLTRREFWKKLDGSSPEKIAETIEWYRDYFAKDTIGTFEYPLSDPNPRTRLCREEKAYTIYDVELDVFEGLTVYGRLLIPAGMKKSEKRPVLVCQHGLEREAKSHIRGENVPGETVFTSEFCEKDYICFAPQGIFILQDRFRFNQRQLNSLGKTLFSIMVPQHQQVCNWLGSLPFVDKEKIGFYGISYGGKTAMRVPPLVKNYALTICSADFNYWNYKNAATLMDFSYIWRDEYEIFEFDLANTFDYSDMARFIAPRPFMVERGHLDQTGLDEYVGFEFGKVRYYYDHCLKAPERAEIKWIDGGHTAYVDKIVPFLDKFLKKEHR
ncbi:hypothetical protein FACS1894163_04220 [Spirochaetia bacterium]|nr:hypothetical protein FACS1894163_04220 [Spirochaetia bacterium]